jgi:hypothetical protein
MADYPTREFGKRRPQPPAPPAERPPKRSSQVALLLMGTFAVGGFASALMPRQTCTPTPPSPGIVAPSSPGTTAPPAVPQPNGTNCTSQGGSSGHSSSRYGLFSSSDSSGRSSSGASSSEASSSSVSRGGFGGFAHAFGFSGGG